MRKVKLIVRKTYQGKQKNKDGKRVRSFLVSDADDGLIWTGAVGGIVRTPLLSLTHHYLFSAPGNGCGVFWFLTLMMDSFGQIRYNKLRKFKKSKK